MSAARSFVFATGLVLVLVGILVLFTATPLATYIPIGVAVAVVLLIIGVAVIAWSDRLGGPLASTTVDRTRLVRREARSPPYDAYDATRYESTTYDTDVVERRHDERYRY